jgi:hypothetical protein
MTGDAARHMNSAVMTKEAVRFIFSSGLNAYVGGINCENVASYRTDPIYIIGALLQATIWPTKAFSPKIGILHRGLTQA